MSLALIRLPMNVAFWKHEETNLHYSSIKFIAQKSTYLPPSRLGRWGIRNRGNLTKVDTIEQVQSCEGADITMYSNGTCDDCNTDTRVWGREELVSWTFLTLLTQKAVKGDKSVDLKLQLVWTRFVINQIVWLKIPRHYSCICLSDEGRILQIRLHALHSHRHCLCQPFMRSCCIPRRQRQTITGGGISC